MSNPLLRRIALISITALITTVYLSPSPAFADPKPTPFGGKTNDRTDTLKPSHHWKIPKERS